MARYRSYAVIRIYILYYKVIGCDLVCMTGSEVEVEHLVNPLKAVSLQTRTVTHVHSTKLWHQELQVAMLRPGCYLHDVYALRTCHVPFTCPSSFSEPGWTCVRKMSPIYDILVVCSHFKPLAHDQCCPH